MPAPFDAPSLASVSVTVPESVRSTASRGLEAHADGPRLSDVHGVALAQRLSSGSITMEDVFKMYRFFRVNTTPYQTAVQEMRTENENATVRSWLLYGGEAGKAWAGRLYMKAIAEKQAHADPILELFELRPEQVYGRFSVGAWRYEYGLDPSKAALFVEQYMLATGYPLDLRKAFGESAEAVGNAVYRRYHTPNPFETLARAQMVRSPMYEEAVRADLNAMQASMGHSVTLEEALSPNFFKSKHVSLRVETGLWSTAIAYLILAVESPKLLKPIRGSAAPPSKDHTTKPYTAYCDANRTYIAYFHPSGPRYKDPFFDEAFQGLDDDVYQMMRRAWYGQNLKTNLVRTTLKQVHDWLAKNKFKVQIFRVLLQHWRSKNWQGILEHIPMDADVYGPFSTLAKTNPNPKDGVELQQKPSASVSKGGKAALAQALKKGVDAFTAKSVGDSKIGEHAEEKGTPLGINSTLKVGSKTCTLAGVFTDDEGEEYTVVVDKATGQVGHITTNMMVGQMKTGHIQVVKAHDDMEGTKYDPEPKPKTDLPTYLVAAVCNSKTEAEKCIAIAKKVGWTQFAGGRTPEEVFRWKT